MNALEDDGKNFEVDALVNSKPVKISKEFSYMRARTEVQNGTKGKVLNSLEFCHV